MKDCSLLFMIVSLHAAQCIISNLIVKKLDETVIARKRQDTMDMCRMFNEENNKLQHNYSPKRVITYRIEKEKTRYKRGIVENSHIEKNRDKRDIKKGNKKDKYGRVEDETSINNRRSKRATMMYALNPALNPEDARRVENIVDRLYDDMEEKGQRVTYRQVPTTSSTRKNMNKTFKPSRRFDFAPAVLKGPQSMMKEKYKPKPDDAPFESKARWKRGIIPYFIDFKTYDAHLSEVIVKAFDYVEKATCIRLQKLREKPTDKQSLEKVPWLYISNPMGIRPCVHSNEKLRVNGVLMAVIGYDCMTLGDIVHETMHILGYSHEHLRSDRDQYISVLWENIKPGYKKYFDLNIPGSEYALESLPYDYSSILHYPPRAFSKNGQATILTEQGLKIGQREGLSEIDVEKVALIYSNECVLRNREYLLQTCPSVVKASTKPINITQREIQNFFKERLWQFGIINYKLRDKMEFTVEERENLKAVFRHIEQETCLQFNDVGATKDDDDFDEDQSLMQPEKKNEGPAPVPDLDEPGNEPVLQSDNLKPQPDKGTMEEPEKPEKLEPDADKRESEAYDNYNEPPTIVADPTKTLPNDKYNEEPTIVAPPIKTLAYDKYNEQPTIVVGPIESVGKEKIYRNPYENENAKKAEIVMTKHFEYGQTGNSKPDAVTSNKHVADNEIQKTDGISSVKALDFKSMNLSMKKNLLKKAKENQPKRQLRRDRRDTSSTNNTSNPQNVRRHANAVLVLKRSADPGCACPNPGTPKGNQVLAIGAGCFNSVNDLLHFFVHLLGLDHQHNMHDRDNYLHIVWENLTADIRQEMENKLPPAASAGFPYDYQSVMHYPWLQIKSGKTNVMYPIWNDGWAMGHWQGLSSVDVQKINLIYNDQCMERQRQENQ